VSPIFDGGNPVATTTRKTSNLKAVQTRQQESPEGSVTFNWRGVEFTIPNAKSWDLDVLEAQEDNRALTAVRLILDEDQYAELRRVAKTIGDFGDFFETMSDQAQAEVDTGK
jgi:hypothetical protein